jgi:hypothetical protein
MQTVFAADRAIHLYVNHRVYLTPDVAHVLKRAVFALMRTRFCLRAFTGL